MLVADTLKLTESTFTVAGTASHCVKDCGAAPGHCESCHTAVVWTESSSRSAFIRGRGDPVSVIGSGSTFMILCRIVGGQSQDPVGAPESVTGQHNTAFLALMLR